MRERGGLALGCLALGSSSPPWTHSRRGGVLPNSPLSPVACLFFLPSYRASFLLPLPSSMAMVIFFLVTVLMVLALVGLLLWFFCLREG
jgi:hypothetical protein